MKLLTKRQETMIINNIVEACKDITKLKKYAYNYLYLCSGFIAHYDLYGFIDFYKENSLLKDLIQNNNANLWENFTVKDKDFAYYNQKRQIYSKAIKKAVEQAGLSLQEVFEIAREKSMLIWYEN